MRIWQIKEQLVEDPSTKLRLEFSSVYTDEVNAGNEPPAHDGLVLIRLWTSDRTRVATFLFERNGAFVRCEVEPLVLNGPDPNAPEQPGSLVQASLDDPLGAPVKPDETTIDPAEHAQPDEAAFGKAAFSGL